MYYIHADLLRCALEIDVRRRKPLAETNFRIDSLLCRWSWNFAVFVRVVRDSPLLSSTTEIHCCTPSLNICKEADKHLSGHHFIRQGMATINLHIKTLRPNKKSCTAYRSRNFRMCLDLIECVSLSLVVQHQDAHLHDTSTTKNNGKNFKHATIKIEATSKSKWRERERERED